MDRQDKAYLERKTAEKDYLLFGMNEGLYIKGVLVTYIAVTAFDKKEALEKGNAMVDDDKQAKIQGVQETKTIYLESGGNEIKLGPMWHIDWSGDNPRFHKP